MTKEQFTEKYKSSIDAFNLIVVPCNCDTPEYCCGWKTLPKESSILKKYVNILVSQQKERT
jgi:hypothetical protein